MIPLGKWLEEGSAPLPPSASEASEVVSAGDLAITEAVPDPASIMARQKDRIKELEEALSVAERAALDGRAMAEAREQELSARLGEELASALVLEVKDCFARLQESLETALVDTLTPFLEHTIVRRAADELGVMIRDAMTASDSLIEVRAPLGLHEVLRNTLEVAGATVTMTDGEKVELIFAAHTARFELLAKRWLHLLTQDCHEQ